MIHPTAIIHPTAVIAESANVGAFTVVGPYCTIFEAVTIGTHCRISGPPEHRAHWSTGGKGVVIGAGSFISNMCTIDSGVEDKTYLGDRVTMLRGSHVGHDCEVGDGVTLSCNCILGGHAVVHQGANLGMGAIVHQRCVVPEDCMLGMGCVITKASKLEPGNVYVGSPSRFLRSNAR